MAVKLPILPLKDTKGWIVRFIGEVKVVPLVVSFTISFFLVITYSDLFSAKPCKAGFFLNIRTTYGVIVTLRLE